VQSELSTYINQTFGVSESIFQSALEMSPGSQGAILGAVSEILLKQQLEEEGFEVLRIRKSQVAEMTTRAQEPVGTFISDLVDQNKINGGSLRAKA